MSLCVCCNAGNFLAMHLDQSESKTLIPDTLTFASDNESHSITQQRRCIPAGCVEEGGSPVGLLAGNGAKEGQSPARKEPVVAEEVLRVHQHHHTLVFC